MIKYLIERTDTNKWGSLGAQQSHRPIKIHWYNNAEIADNFDSRKEAEEMLFLYTPEVPELNNYDVIVTEHEFIDTNF